MALSEKKALTDKKHLDKLDKMKIQPYKEEGAEIRAAALSLIHISEPTRP